MFARVTTVAFEGIEARAVDVQVQIGPGLPAFAIVGLPDKAVAESRERVRGALNAIGLALPPKRITVNLAPADLPKEGSHYDLPIVLGLMAATGAVPRDAIEGFCVLGELSLDGSIAAVAGALPAAIGANALHKGLICPASCGAEAAWAAADMTILAPQDLLQLINHFKGLQTLRRPQPTPDPGDESMPDLKDIKGQETASRARSHGRGRPPSLSRPARANRCWRGGCPRSCRRSSRRRCRAFGSTLMRTSPGPGSGIVGCSASSRTRGRRTERYADGSIRDHAAPWETRRNCRISGKVGTRPDF
jgi:hypothetical protein